MLNLETGKTMIGEINCKDGNNLVKCKLYYGGLAVGEINGKKIYRYMEYAEYLDLLNAFLSSMAGKNYKTPSTRQIRADYDVMIEAGARRELQEEADKAKKIQKEKEAEIEQYKKDREEDKATLAKYMQLHEEERRSARSESELLNKNNKRLQTLFLVMILVNIVMIVFNVFMLIFR